jgi:hypothetical protein
MATGKVMIPSICEVTVSSEIRGLGQVRRTHDKQPAPTREATESIHRLVDGRLQETTKHATGESRAGKDGASLAEFLFSVPRSENEMRARKHTRLRVSLEESDHHNVFGAFGSSRAHGKGRPDANHQREKDSGAKSREKQVVWDNATAQS